jgi:hypothetical protein
VKFRYASGGMLVAALLVLPTSAAASQVTQVDSLSAQHCAQERAAIGKKAFRKRYGAKRTMRACVRHNRGFVVAAFRVANQDCQDELAMIGPTDFIDEYGEDPSDSVDNAMTECVAEEVDLILNPDTGDDGTDDGTGV